MAEQGLQLNIGANIDDFQKSLDQAVKGVQNFDAKTQAALKSTATSFKSIDQLSERLNRLRDAQAQAGDVKTFAGLQKAIDVTRARLDLLNKGFGGLGSITTAASVQALDELNKRLDQLKAAQAADPKAFDGLQRSIEATTAQIKVLQGEFNAIGSKPISADTKAYQKAIDELTEKLDRLKSVQSSVGSAKGFNGLQKEIDATAKSIAQLNKEFASVQSLDNLTNKLERLKAAQAKAVDGKAFAGYQKAIDVTATRIEGLRGKLDALGAGNGRFVRGTNQAQTALINLGRVASDLPFGFIAIQNNLEPLFLSFQQLSAKAGSTVGGLKLLGSALVGAGGLGLAFSVVSSAITIAIQKYGSLGAAVQALFSANRQLLETQKLITDAVKEGNKNAGEQVANFRYLAEAVANTALSDKVRADALKKLKEEYPSYLKNLTDEQILNGALKGTIDEVTKSLRARAVAQATVAKAGTAEADILDQQVKEENSINRLNELLKQRDKLLKQPRTQTPVVTGFGSQVDPIAEINKQINAEERNKAAIGETIKAKQKQLDIILNVAQKETLAAGEAAIANEKQAKSLDPALAKQKKALEERLKGYEIELKTIERTTGAASSQYLKLARTISETKAQIKIIGEGDPTVIKEINQTLANDLIDINSQLTKAEQEEYKKQLQNAVSRYEREAKIAKDTYGSISAEFLAAQKKLKTGEANLKIAVAIENKDAGAIDDIRKDLQNDLDQLEKDFSKRRVIEGQIDFVPLLKLEPREALEKFKRFFYTLKSELDKKAVELSQGKITVKTKIIVSPEVQGVLDAVKAAKEKLSDIGDDILDALVSSYGKLGPLNEEIISQIARISEVAAQGAQVFGQLFSPIIDNFFENIENGKSAFESLGKSIKQFVINAVKELAKLAAIAAGITIFSGGRIPFSTAFNIAAKGSSFAPRQQAAPRFGAVQGGSLAISVGGQFNVRGTDLVAVVAQSNQRIGRVG